MPSPTDPSYGAQAQFLRIGDIETVWDDYTGRGITVGIFDDGVQSAHPDLSANYDPSLHFSYLGTTYSAEPGASDHHGTSVAGIVAAGADNGQGGVGVAYGSRFAGVDLYTDVWANSSSGFNLDANGDGISDGQTAAFAHMAAFDVVNNSWGVPASSLFGGDISLNNPSGFDSVYARTIASDVAASGRGGLGTLVVKSAGNGAANSNGEGLDAAQHTIVVAATNSTGTVASYSDWGSNVLVAAPASNYTTDRTGSAGYTSSDYTTFGGSSAAAPVVTGVIALMLEANPGLGWRDVHEILALSAGQTGAQFGGASSGFEQGSWASNGAENWNGGGLSYHLSYGFGMVDAFSAVRMAEAWGWMYGTAQTSGNELVEARNNGTGAVPITQASGTQPGVTEIEFQMSSAIDVQHGALNVHLSHARGNELALSLISPDGSAHVLMQTGDVTPSATASGFAWTFGVTSVQGTYAPGTWTLRIEDTANAGFDDGQVLDAQLSLRGRAHSQDSVQHITDDFLAVSAVEGARSHLDDLDGGTDWLNLSAVSGDIGLSISAGGQLAVAGAPWATIASAAYENVVAGDGADQIVGNDSTNHLIGMRGNDVLDGRGGSDWLWGGLGDDELQGGDGSDRLSGDAGADTLRGGAGLDTLEGGAGADTLRGDFGIDLLRGGSGHDWLYGNADRDRLFGDGGVDRLRGGEGNDRLYGGASNDTLLGEDGRDFLDGGSGRDKLIGGAQDDVLNGGIGDDSLTGGSGRDTFLFRKDMDADTVKDFDQNADRLKIDQALALGASNGAEIVSSFGRLENGNAILDFGDGDMITFLGIGVLDGLAGTIDLF